MNRIYKTVWNAVRRCLVVVNEAAQRQGSSGNLAGNKVQMGG